MSSISPTLNTKNNPSPYQPSRLEDCKICSQDKKSSELQEKLSNAKDCNTCATDSTAGKHLHRRLHQRYFSGLLGPDRILHFPNHHFHTVSSTYKPADPTQVGVTGTHQNGHEHHITKKSIDDNAHFLASAGLPPHLEVEDAELGFPMVNPGTHHKTCRAITVDAGTVVRLNHLIPHYMRSPATEIFEYSFDLSRWENLYNNPCAHLSTEETPYYKSETDSFFSHKRIPLLSVKGYVWPPKTMFVRVRSEDRKFEHLLIINVYSVEGTGLAKFGSQNTISPTLMKDTKNTISVEAGQTVSFQGGTTAGTEGLKKQYSLDNGQTWKEFDGNMYGYISLKEGPESKISQRYMTITGEIVPPGPGEMLLKVSSTYFGKEVNNILKIKVKDPLEENTPSQDRKPRADDDSSEEQRRRPRYRPINPNQLFFACNQSAHNHRPAAPQNGNVAPQNGNAPAVPPPNPWTGRRPHVGGASGGGDNADIGGAAAINPQNVASGGGGEGTGGEDPNPSGVMVYNDGAIGVVTFRRNPNFNVPLRGNIRHYDTQIRVTAMHAWENRAHQFEQNGIVDQRHLMGVIESVLENYRRSGRRPDVNRRTGGLMYIGPAGTINGRPRNLLIVINADNPNEGTVYFPDGDENTEEIVARRRDPNAYGDRPR